MSGVPDVDELVAAIGRTYDAPEVVRLRQALQADAWPARPPRPHDNLYVALAAKPSGADLTFKFSSSQTHLLHQLNFWSEEYTRHGYTPFAGSLMCGLAFGQTPETVAERLGGPPMRSRVVDDAVRGATWITDGLRILVQFSSGSPRMSALEVAHAD